VQWHSKVAEKELQRSAELLLVAGRQLALEMTGPFPRDATVYDYNARARSTQN
jgi:hypothetical protein